MIVRIVLFVEPASSAFFGLLTGGFRWSIYLGTISTGFVVCYACFYEFVPAALVWVGLDVAVGVFDEVFF